MTTSPPDIAFADIDTQIDFIEPHGKLYAQGAEAIKPNLARLIAAARAQGIPLISSVDAHYDDATEFSQFPPHCLKGTEGQLKIAETRTGVERFVVQDAPEFPDPRTHHIVIEKDAFPVFTNPVAERVFAAAGVKRVAVFGVVTEVCVRHAAMGLRERGYEVALVTDAIWPIEKSAGEAAIKEMTEAGCSLTTTEALLAELGA